jgi:multiple antibiotic resistance protein
LLRCKAASAAWRAAAHAQAPGFFTILVGAPRYDLATQRKRHRNRRRDSGFINMARRAGYTDELPEPPLDTETHMVESLIPDILFGFTGLISIINPIGIAFVFLDRTASLSTEERTLLARKIAINVVCVLLVAFFIGTPILHFFGISMQALRIGGGLAVAVGGWQMLNAPDTQPGEQPAVKRVDADNAMSKAFFPFTIPLTTGPGSIATAIALTANRTHKLSEFVISSIASVVISLAVAVTVYLVYSRAVIFAKYLGVEGTKVAMRVSSFLLLCIGVQIMLTGFSEFLIPIATLQPVVK